MMLLLIALISSGVVTADERFPYQGDIQRAGSIVEPADMAYASDDPHWLADNSGQFRYASGNPWALPEPKSGLDAPPDWRSGRYGQQDGAAEVPGRRENNWNSTGGRFVTPEILESLKKQQTQAQRVNPGYSPGQYYNQGYSSGNFYPGRGSYYGANIYGTNRRMYNSPYGGYFSPYGGYFSPYGMSYYDPLYNAPATSPWLWQPDPLLGGGGFGYYPEGGIGEIAPMEMSNFSPVLGDGMPGMQNRLFNPYNFLNDMR
jgi:hypothetical protein